MSQPKGRPAPLQPPPQAPLSSVDLFSGGQRFARFTLFLSLTMMVALLVAFGVQRRIPPPSYTLVAGEKLTPLEISENPMLSIPKIQAWSSRAVRDIFTFDFRNADDHLAGMQPYFTSTAWSSFNTAITTTELYKTVSNNSIRVQVTPLQDAYVAAPAQMAFGRVVWPSVEVPVLISYIGSFAKGTAPPVTKQTIVLSLVEVDLADSPDGIQIASMTPMPYKPR